MSNLNVDVLSPDQLTMCINRSATETSQLWVMHLLMLIHFLMHDFTELGLVAVSELVNIYLLKKIKNLSQNISKG